MILNRENNQIIDFEKYNISITSTQIPFQELKNWFESNKEILHLSFKASKVSVYADVFTVMPVKAEKPDEVFALLGYEEKTNSTVLKDKINDSFIVYFRVDDEIVRFVDNQLVNTEFYACDSGLLRFYNDKMAHRNYLAAHVYGEDLTICHKKDKSNLYYNKFKLKAKEDLLYYLQLAYSNLGLNPDEFPTYLYGFIEEKSPLYSTSYNYLRNFEIDRTLKNILPFLYATEDSSLHYYVNLWGLYFE